MTVKEGFEKAGLPAPGYMIEFVEFFGVFMTDTHVYSVMDKEWQPLPDCLIRYDVGIDISGLVIGEAINSELLPLPVIHAWEENQL